MRSSGHADPSIREEELARAFNPRPEIRSADVSLRTELADDLRYIEGDAIQLEQVLMNLVLNAIEAMRACSEGPRDLLLCPQNRGSDQIVIAVRYWGVGIDSDTVDDPFRPFVSSKARGLGLGLSISRSIVEAHGGVLWGERNADRGATFQFILPACLATPKASMTGPSMCFVKKSPIGD